MILGSSQKSAVLLVIIFAISVVLGWFYFDMQESESSELKRSERWQLAKWNSPDDKPYLKKLKQKSLWKSRQPKGRDKTPIKPVKPAPKMYWQVIGLSESEGKFYVHITSRIDNGPQKLTRLSLNEKLPDSTIITAITKDTYSSKDAAGIEKTFKLYEARLKTETLRPKKIGKKSQEPKNKLAPEPNVEDIISQAKKDSAQSASKSDTKAE